METLVQMLHAGGYSCVIRNGEEIQTFTRKGVIDLYEVIEQRPMLLRGACVADKVVGKGAAALMVLGGIKAVHTDIISTPALALLQKHGIQISYAVETAQIMNRAKDGFCPVETLCMELQTVDEMYHAISQFIKQNFYGK